MKNTVYSLARASQASSLEEFALVELASHFIETNPYAEVAGIANQIDGLESSIEIEGTHFPICVHA